MVEHRICEAEVPGSNPYPSDLITYSEPRAMRRIRRGSSLTHCTASRNMETDTNLVDGHSVFLMSVLLRFNGRVRIRF